MCGQSYAIRTEQEAFAEPVVTTVKGAAKIISKYRDDSGYKPKVHVAFTDIKGIGKWNLKANIQPHTLSIGGADKLSMLTKFDVKVTDFGDRKQYEVILP